MSHFCRFYGFSAHSVLFSSIYVLDSNYQSHFGLKNVRHIVDRERARLLKPKANIKPYVVTKYKLHQQSKLLLYSWELLQELHSGLKN